MSSSGKYPRKVSVKFKKLEVRDEREKDGCLRGASDNVEPTPLL